MVDSPLRLRPKFRLRYICGGKPCLEEHISEQLFPLIGTDRLPVVVDVRREQVFRASGDAIAGAIWRDHLRAAEWSRDLPDRPPIVVYCIHGHNVSELAAALLAAAGVDVAMLEGGMEAYDEAGGPMVAREGPGVDVAGGPSVWVTRERPKIDRIACPWLIRRFIDPLPIFHFVAAEWVKDIAEEIGASPTTSKECTTRIAARLHLRHADPRVRV